MKIKKVIVEGFRAYQAKEDGTFDFSMPTGECANFVSLYAPNGFGKTSFYDAVEWAMTNNIGRFIRDYTRAENDNLSKSQNQPSKKQYILRNRFIPDTEPSRVTVVYDNGESKVKDVPKAKSGSRDYLFKKEDPEKGFEALSDVFLSQEAIDAFLREEKPEARYVRFMSTFGDDDETYRANLTALKRELSIMLKSSEDEAEQLKKTAEAPVQEAIFEDINETINTLNTSNENISPIDKTFNNDREREISSLITKRTHDLLAKADDSKNSIAALLAATSKIEDIFAAQQRKVSSKTLLDKAISRRMLVARRQELVASIASLQSALQTESIRENRLIEVASRLPKFQLLNESIKTARENLHLTQQHLYGVQSEAQSFSQRSEKCQRSIVELDTTIGKLLELQSTSTSIFPQIGTLEELIATREAARSTKKLRQQALATKISHEREELEKVQAIEVNEATIDSTDIAPLLKENFSTLPLKAAILERQARASDFDAAIKNLDQVRAQANQFTHLIELGASLLSHSQSSECPLCTHQHPSHQSLMDALVNNTALSDLESTAMRAKEISRAALDEASNKVSIQIAEWSATKMRVGMSLRHSIEKDENEVQALKIELDQIDQAISVTSLQLVALKTKVNNLPEEQLNSSIASQLSELARRRSSELKDLEESSTKLNQLNNIIKENLQKIEQLNAGITLALDSDLAREVNQFCLDNALQPDQIDLSIQQSRAEIQARISATHTHAESAHGELLALDLADPTLAKTTTEELDKHEIDLRSAIVDSDTTIVPFVATIKRHLQSYEDSWDRETLSSAVSETMAQRQKDVDQITHILRQYSLLGEQLIGVKPYIESLVAKQKLEGLLLRIQQERALNSSLEAEYSKTIERLRKRINGFFYSDLINAIYRKIDPHPDFKEVQFDCDFPDESLPKLNVLVADSEGDVIAPNLYFSAAQINILSLSIFLARALHVKTADGMDVKCIFIDDPIHSMDSINVLATIDMLRTLSKKFDRQIILSTHDRNFFDLLQKKIPQKEYLSKFIELETFGKVRSAHMNSEKDSDIFS
jgi:exonuclease SbcC